MNDQPKTTPWRHARARGFSLLELSLVIAIMGILMAVAAWNLMGGANDAKVTATKASMRTIQTALETYQVNHNRLPPSLATIIPSKLKDGSQLDAWDRPFYYNPDGASPERPFTLISTGADGQAGTEDDLDVWIDLKREAQ